MAFIQLEDMTGTAEIILFPRLFKHAEPWLENYSVFVVKGIIDCTSLQLCKIKANACIPIDLLLDSQTQLSRIQLMLPPSPTDDVLTMIKQHAQPGKIPLELHYTEQGKSLYLASKKTIAQFSPQGIEEIEKANIAIKLHL